MSPVESDNTSPADDLESPQQSEGENAQAPSSPEELQAKYAAAQKEASEWRGRAETRAEEINRLKKALVSDTSEEATPEPKPATTNDLTNLKDEIRWELKNESQIEIANQNGRFDQYVKEGKSKQDALKLALYDEGITNSGKRSESMRQAASSAAPSFLNRKDEAVVHLSDTDKAIGIKPDTVKKYRDYVEA